MSRSQRHNLENYSTTSAGYVHAQGVLAPSILAQLDVTTPAMNVVVVEGRKEQPPTLYETEATSGWAVPVGEPGGPLAGSSLSGAIPVDAPPAPNPGPKPGPDPEPGMEPTLNSINPSSARIGSADVVMNVNGSNFTETSLIYFNGGAETTSFYDSSKLSTIVKPSTATVEGSFPVWVQQGSVRTATEKTFTFLPQATEGTRSIPSGPFDLASVDDDDAGIAITVPDGTDIRVGDTVLVEATGNTGVNGSYEVLTVEGAVIIVDNPFVLSAPIVAKGRVTVTAEVPA